MVNFLNELLQVLSHECQINFEFMMASSMFKTLLKSENAKKLEDLEVDFNLNIDSLSMKKAKKIMLTSNPILDEDKKTYGLIMSLLEEIQLDADFSNSQELFNQMGGNDILGMALGQT